MANVASRVASALVIGSLLLSPAARAENQMGYKLVDQNAAQLPRGGGSVGLDVGRGQVIRDRDITFELLQVKSVRAGSPASRSGLSVGDQVIAVDGRVFPSVAAFAGFVGSMPAGRTIAIDYMPRGGGPENAQRVGVTLGNAGTRPTAPAAPLEPESHGLTTGQKLAIGAGAVALFGCYKLGCFNRRAPAQSVPRTY